ncbi:MAG: FliA/WhiG family RNA polymerase sigma factor [Verrucomicrobia bacterium]|nr:FliA/WhiG family RNA polymerase sigma factor [Verrucomicrobiota bacterium]MBI3871405.1 FliA/WhiG family RNA polymerase sigma factor [Verrucomicrobiota bacterium]
MSKQSTVCLEDVEKPAPSVKGRKRKPGPSRSNPWPQPGTPDEALMVEQNLGMVRSVVARLSLGLPTHVDGDDLYSAGLGGLLNAIRAYNPQAGTSFETYARVRIRGAILDELRRMDWVPRSIHTKARKVQAVAKVIEQKKGRQATEEEIAKGLDISLREYRRWAEEIRPATIINLDADLQSDTDDSLSQYESLADSRAEDPVEGAFRHELAELIVEQLHQLPEMQRQVLALYYFEEMRLAEIAAAFSLTESRICQIHAQALQSIKGCLQRCDPCFMQPYSF